MYWQIYYHRRDFFEQFLLLIDFIWLHVQVNHFVHVRSGSPSFNENLKRCGLWRGTHQVGIEHRQFGDLTSCTGEVFGVNCSWSWCIRWSWLLCLPPVRTVYTAAFHIRSHLWKIRWFRWFGWSSRLFGVSSESRWSAIQYEVHLSEIRLLSWFAGPGRVSGAPCRWSRWFRWSWLLCSYQSVTA